MWQFHNPQNCTNSHIYIDYINNSITVLSDKSVSFLQFGNWYWAIVWASLSNHYVRLVRNELYNLGKMDRMPRDPFIIIK